MQNNEMLRLLYSDRSDLDEDYIAKCLVNENEYWKINKIKNEGVRAIDHYFKYANEKNLVLPKVGVFGGGSKPKKNGMVLYLSSANSTDGSFLYRCRYQSEKHKKSMVYNNSASLYKKIRAIFNCETLIFSRPEYRAESIYLLELAKNIGVKVVLDYDDYLLPDAALSLGSVKSDSGESYEASFKNLVNKTSIMFYADEFICSTPKLAEKMAVFNKPISIKRNNILSNMVAAESVVTKRCSGLMRRKVKILYMSGTATHRYDYSIIEPVILKLLQNHGDKFDITFMGNTGLSQKLYSNFVNVGFISRVDFNDMLKFVSMHDLALVPLHVNDFNDAKSNIKFLECGSQGVPVICSPAAEFNYSIVNGVDGWIAKTPADWYTILVDLINHPLKLYRAACHARNKVINEFSIQALK